MNKYNNGKIYKIIDNTNGNIYIGSTIRSLKERLQRHKKLDCISKNIIKNGDYRIELIEDYPCNTKKELLIREQYYIDNSKCINLINPIFNKEEYYLNNKNRIKEYKKKYYEKNKNGKIKKYYEKNKDRKKEYNKKWKDENKEYHKKLRIYKNSFGGDSRSDNNLLLIDINLFT